MTRLVVTGANGQTGGLVCKLAEAANDMTLVGKIDLADSLEEVIEGADVVVDFTDPAATPTFLAVATRYKKAMVIGTTGHDGAGHDAIEKASRAIPIVFSPNMSIGVNLLFTLVTSTARILGKNYRVEIVETHHARKKDKPSGTAKRLAEAVATARNENADAIEIHSFRQGEVIGEHTVTFLNPDERVSLSHLAANREIFAQGALAAARWVVTQEPHLYTMADVLRLRL